MSFTYNVATNTPEGEIHIEVQGLDLKGLLEDIEATILITPQATSYVLTIVRHK